MDEMDYVMHSPEPPSTPQSQQPGCLACRRPDQAFYHNHNNNHHQQSHHHHHHHPSPHHHTAFSPNHPHPRPPYDPVGPGSPWLAQSAPFQWPLSQGSLSLPPVQAPRLPGPDPFLGSANPSYGSPTGPLQQGYQPSPQFQPSYDPFASAPYLQYRHMASLQRSANVPQAGQQTPRNQMADGRLPNTPPRSVAPPQPLSLNLTPSPPQPQPSMPVTGDSSSPAGENGRPAPTAPASPPPRGHGRVGSTSLTTPPEPSSAASRQRHDPFAWSEPPTMYGEPLGQSHIAPPTPITPMSNETRRAVMSRYQRPHRGPAAGSDGDSEEDQDGEGFPYRRLIQDVSAIQAAGEAHLRAHQVIRGQVSTKRVASRSAISSLQSVEIDSLPESERTCVICYNEFGIPNPEGINEAPLRLPKCQHVFGDHCIKKWFEESDSCPYCRDKVPSEPQLRANSDAVRNFLRAIRAGPPLRDAEVEGDGLGFEVWLNRRDFQPGARRSPPDDSSEPRRRMRPRHGSLRASPLSTATNSNGSTSTSNRPDPYTGVPRPSSSSAAAAAATQQQQSPGRERLAPTHLQHLWHNENMSDSQVRRSITPRVTRHYNPVYGQHHHRWSGYHNTSPPSNRNSSHGPPPATQIPSPPGMPFDGAFLPHSPLASSPHSQAFSPNHSSGQLNATHPDFLMLNPRNNNGVPEETAPRYSGHQDMDVMRRGFDPPLPPIGADGTIGPFPSMFGTPGNQSHY